MSRFFVAIGHVIFEPKDGDPEAVMIGEVNCEDPLSGGEAQFAEACDLAAEIVRRWNHFGEMEAMLKVCANWVIPGFDGSLHFVPTLASAGKIREVLAKLKEGGAGE